MARFCLVEGGETELAEGESFLPSLIAASFVGKRGERSGKTARQFLDRISDINQRASDQDISAKSSADVHRKVTHMKYRKYRIFHS